MGVVLASRVHADASHLAAGELCEQADGRAAGSLVGKPARSLRHVEPGHPVAVGRRRSGVDHEHGVGQSKCGRFADRHRSFIDAHEPSGCLPEPGIESVAIDHLTTRQRDGRPDGHVDDPVLRHAFTPHGLHAAARARR